MKFSNLTINLLPAQTRVETLEGREHIVVPMVILTEGVHSGSGGPVYYPKDELSKTPEIWNHKPVVVYHPMMNGQGISACQPDVLNNRKVGIMLNTKFEDGKLKSEAWIEKVRANAVDERIMTAIETKEMMEVSTGLFMDNEDTTGKWQSEEYKGVARNYKPDHLALLPDQIGACSISDGAGFLRNQAGDGKKKTSEKQALKHLAQRLGLIDNEQSYSNISSLLSTKIREKFKVGEDGPWIWVVDVYSNFFVYEKDAKFWRLGYMSNDTDVSLSDETPVEVKRVTEYRTVDGSFVGNRQPATKTTEQDKTMNKKEKIDGIIAANAGWAEADRKNLEVFNDAQLDIVSNSVKKPEPTPAPTPVTPKAPEAPAPTVNNTPAPATPKTALTVDEYISNAPPQMREVLNDSMSALNEEKAKLVAGIMANEANPFGKEELESQPIAQLRKLARLSASTTAPQMVTYEGQAPTPRTNRKEEEALPVPTMNHLWEKKDAKAA